jgi:hypothetical protein
MVSPKVIFYNTPGKYTIFLSSGRFRFELWGASGGRSNTNSSRGAYVSGCLNVYSPRTFFAYVGEKGTKSNSTVTFNGGGGAFTTSSDDLCYACSGGGATDVRLAEGNWNSIESLKSRIIVSGGGGGEVNNMYDTGNNPVSGGCGGFLVGEEGSYSNCKSCVHSDYYLNATGGEQKRGGKGGSGNYVIGSNGAFGEGGTALKPPILEPWPSSGGGGGYFGGGAGGIQSGYLGSGAGGSSFVSGHKDCSAVSSSYSSSNQQFSGYVHYSGLAFHNIFYYNGNETFASPTGDMEWNYIDGAIKITFLKEQYTCKAFDYQYTNLLILNLFILS